MERVWLLEECRITEKKVATINAITRLANKAFLFLRISRNEPYIINNLYYELMEVAFAKSASSLYNVNFHVNNVPSGFLWGVTLSNTTKYENTQCISIQVKNGIYTYTLLQVSGYMVSPLSGSVSVNNSNVVIQVYYVKGDPPEVSAMSGYSLALFTAIAALVAVAAFTAFLFVRKKKEA